MSQTQKVRQTWNEKPLRRVLTSVRAGVWGTDPEFEGEGIRCVRVADFNRQTLSAGNAPTLRHLTDDEFRKNSLRPGDLLIEKSGGTPKNPVGFVTQFTGGYSAVCANFIARMRVSEGQHSRFWLYALNASYNDGRTWPYVNQTTGIQNLSLSAFLTEKFLVPSLAEQRTIADYLDRETAKIDTLIEKQTAMIEKLKERRARVVEATIRRGLDSSVVFQESGDVALGAVPAHWRVCRMKHIGRPIIGLTYSPEEIVSEDEGTLVLRAGNIQEGQINLANTVHVSTVIPAGLRTREGDILICARNGSAALIGKNAVIPKELSGQTWGAFMVVLRSPLNSYLRWFLNSAVFRAQTGQFATTTINQLTTRTLGNLVITLPPLEEQHEIADYLDRETAKIDTLITKVERHIELAKERRAALITAAVTGQIDVTKDAV